MVFETLGLSSYGESLAFKNMTMSAADYKKNIADTFYTIVGAGALIINYGLEKGKIVRKAGLKFDMLDAAKLFVYLSAGVYAKKWWIWVGYPPLQCLYKRLETTYAIKCIHLPTAKYYFLNICIFVI